MSDAVVERANPFQELSSISEFLQIWLENALLSPNDERLLHRYYQNFRKLRSARLRHVYAEQIREAEDFVRRNPSSPRVLEIGSGCGTEALWLALNGAAVTSIDIREPYIELARHRQEVLENFLQRSLPCRFQVCSIVDLNDVEGFDLVWMEQTFHHLEPREECARTIARLLRPDGTLVISEANALNPLIQLQLLLYRGTRTIITGHWPDGRAFQYGNERVLSPFALRALFARYGVLCERLRYFRFFPSHPIFDNLGWIDRKLRTRWLLPFHTHYNFVGRKVAD